MLDLDLSAKETTTLELMRAEIESAVRRRRGGAGVGALGRDAR